MKWDETGILRSSVVGRDWRGRKNGRRGEMGGDRKLRSSVAGQDADGSLTGRGRD